MLVPGGRLGFTVWGHIKKSLGAWSLSPFQLASQTALHDAVPPQVREVVTWGRPADE